MNHIALIFLGGGLGSVLRHWVKSVFDPILSINFPYGTLIVNTTGSLIMGVLLGYANTALSFSSVSRSFLIIGFLGGYTTFSSFSAEVVSLIQKGDILAALLYIFLSIFVSMLFVGAGLAVPSLFI